MNLMETKKQSKSDKASRSSLHSASEFVGEVKQEIHRINWTSKDELKVYTKIVVAATFLLGIGIFAVDLVIRGCLDSIGTLVHWIAG